MLDLPAAHYGGYYEGFANSALWPALHSRSRSDPRLAGRLSLLSRSQRLHGARAAAIPKSRTRAFWIQDYHFLALGAELRDLGVTPADRLLPAYAVAGARRSSSGVPHHRELIEAMLAYDLIGFQTEDDCENFLGYVAVGSRSRRA